MDRSTLLLVDVNAGLSLLVSVSVFLRVRYGLYAVLRDFTGQVLLVTLAAQVLLSVPVAGLS